ncbi:MAG TPA: hypothetical protein VE978_20225 [Chitinophagales bacterium]|nr:hypothetical protein [Chitinophagales bacterium]
MLKVLLFLSVSNFHHQLLFRNFFPIKEKLQSANNELQYEFLQMKDQLQQFDQTLSQCCSQSTSCFATLQISNSKPETVLGQNIPNPFDNSTLIPFRIPKDCNDASIIITNTSTSQVISVIPISCNEDHISIDAGTLAGGTYSYTLYVDRKMIDSKVMILTK